MLLQMKTVIISEDLKQVSRLDNSNNPQFETSINAPVCIDKHNRL